MIVYISLFISNVDYWFINKKACSLHRKWSFCQKLKNVRSLLSSPLNPLKRTAAVNSFKFKLPLPVRFPLCLEFSRRFPRKMTSAALKNRSAITLKGSAEIVCDYLNYGINSILFQRGLYPSENFKTVENYGLTILMSTDEKIKEFLFKTLEQLKGWLVDRTVEKVALIITNVKTLEVMERWDFKVEYEGKGGGDTEQTSEKPLKQIKNEIRNVIRQITSSVTYLPLLDCLCSFDIQVYTKEDSTLEMPEGWETSQPANIKNAQSVKMHSFSTNIHKMETVVTYKNDE